MLICGIDEAGRGPLAGPVVAAAVVFEDNAIVEGARDSKTLSETLREGLYDKIRERCLEYSIGAADHIEIDALNILKATMLAMERALNSLSTKPDLVLIDGNYFRLPEGREGQFNFKTIIKGDSSVNEISCASILAKVTRDRIMKDFHKIYPVYKFNSNKGYPTPFHISAIRSSGICEIHRKTFCAKFVNGIRESNE